MKRENKMGWLIAVVLSAVIISITVWGYTTQKWGRWEETREIWLPESYQMANKKDNVYTSISDVQPSGTAVYISLEEYKRLFNETTVAITEKGKVYYWTEQGKVTYVAFLQLESTSEGETPQVVQILNDKEIELRFDESFVTVLVGAFVVVLGFVSSFPLAYKIDTVFPSRKD